MAVANGAFGEYAYVEEWNPGRIWVKLLDQYASVNYGPPSGAKKKRKVVKDKADF